MQKVEAVLFAASRRMKLQEIVDLLESKENEIKKALATLKEKYQQQDTALTLLNDDDSWKISLKDEYLPFAEKLMPSTELPKPVIETLAIIAWKNPILQSDLVKLRSAVVYDHIADLEELKLITRSKKGRSYLVKVTDKFYDYFDVPQDKSEELFEDYEMPSESEEENKDFNKGDSFDEKNEEREKRIIEEIKNNKIDPDEIIRKDKEFLDEFDHKLRSIEERSFDADQTLKNIDDSDLQDDDIKNEIEDDIDSEEKEKESQQS